MTDEKLEQILKQSLALEIEDSEIQIQRKERTNRMKMKNFITGGLAACVALTMVVAGGFVRLSKTEGIETPSRNIEQDIESRNLFVITAYAAELPEGVASGDVLNLSFFNSDSSTTSGYLSGRFAISGQNIERIKISTDKCNIYSATPLYKGDTDFEKAQAGETNSEFEKYVMIVDTNFEHDEKNAFEQKPYHYERLVIEGNIYEGVYNENMSFGMSVPEELWSTNNDMKAAFHEDIDQVNDATLTIEVTFTDGNTEIHSYKLHTGKIYVPADENGILLWNNLTRFLTEDEDAEGTTPYAYGYLMEKID